MVRRYHLTPPSQNQPGRRRCTRVPPATGTVRRPLGCCWSRYPTLWERSKGHSLFGASPSGRRGANSFAKRLRRHQQRNKSPTRWQGSVCAVCGRVCDSTFGLSSHMRRHKGTRWAALSSIGRTTKKERECWVYCVKSQFSQYLKILWIFSLFSLMNYKTCILKVCPNCKHYSVVFRAWAALPEGAAAISSWKFRKCTEFWYRL